MRKLYILFGPPGCGKGTQAELLVTKYGLYHVSTGDLLRKEAETDIELGKAMASCKLIPDEKVISLISACFAQYKTTSFLFDGFPRTGAQAEALDTLLAAHGITLAGVIFLRVPDEELIPRLIKRGETSGREDDATEEGIKVRLEEYINKTAPVYDYYQDNGARVIDIDGMGEVITIHGRICGQIDALPA